MLSCGLVMGCMSLPEDVEKSHQPCTCTCPGGERDGERNRTDWASDPLWGDISSCLFSLSCCILTLHCIYIARHILYTTTAHLGVPKNHQTTSAKTVEAVAKLSSHPLLFAPFYFTASGTFKRILRPCVYLYPPQWWLTAMPLVLKPYEGQPLAPFTFSPSPPATSLDPLDGDAAASGARAEAAKPATFEDRAAAKALLRPPADFAQERDMPILGARPLGDRSEPGRGLVSCESCSRVVMENAWTEHQR